MKKIMSALAVLTLSLTLLSGCKKSTDYRMFDYDLSQYITLGNFIGVEYTYDLADVTDEKVTEYTNSLLSEKGYGEAVQTMDRAAVLGDTVNIDYVGMKDGVAFEGGTEEGADLKLGSNTFIDGFETGLVGAKPGETRSLNLTFPEDYHNADLAGQAVVFEVTVNYISETVYPELTDALAQEISDKATVAEYLQYAKEQVSVQNEQDAAKEMETEIWNKVVESTDVISYPEEEVEYYKNLLLKSAESNSQSTYGMSYEEFLKKAYDMTLEDIDDQITKQAQLYVKYHMIYVAIARDQDLDYTDAEYEEKLASAASTNGYSSTQEFKESIDEKQFYISLVSERAVDYVIENAVRTN